MKVDVVMPQMGESIAEGTLAKWLKKVGDRVERDESILEITTDKIDSEIPAPESGTLAEVLVEEGETVDVGTVLARLETEAATDESAPEEPDAGPPEKEDRDKAEDPQRGSASEPTGKEDREPPAEGDDAGADSEQHKRFYSPVVKRIAEEKGLDEDELAGIEGTGLSGRVTKTDVLEYLDERDSGTAERTEPEQPSRKQEPPPKRPSADRPAPVAPSAEQDFTVEFDESRSEIIEMSNMRRRIAEHMVHSKRTSPHTYNAAEVDMTPIVRFREKVKRGFERDEGFKLTYTHFILHAVALALKAHPLMNSSVDGDRIIRKEYINLGLAVAVEDGLLVPVIKGADEKNLLGIARAAHELGEKARGRKLSPDDLRQGTFTVTNPGVFGNIFGLPIINQPQAGILGVGAVRKRAVVVDDAIAIRSMMYITLSYDHRIIDGAYAARFIQQVRSNLETYDTDNAL